MSPGKKTKIIGYKTPFDFAQGDSQTERSRSLDLLINPNELEITHFDNSSVHGALSSLSAHREGKERESKY